MELELRVGSIAKKAGVGVQTLHYYERIGLLPKPTRSEANYRLYSPDALRRVRFIKKAQALGFKLEEIKQILDLKSHGRAPCRKVTELGEQHLREIDASNRTTTHISSRCGAIFELMAGEDGAPAQLRRRVLRFDRASAIGRNFFEKKFDPLRD